MIKPTTNPPRMPAPTPYDAWCLARLRCGLDLEDPTRRASGPYKLILRRMAGALPDDRGGIWTAHLDALDGPDAESLLAAVAAASPSGPAPEDDGWGMPELERPVPVEPFPLEVLPEPVARLARQAARAIGCPADFPAMSALAVAGLAIGRSASLRLKDGYFASTCLYTALVGKPGDGKSPAMGAVLRPLWKIDEEAHEAYVRQMADYVKAVEEHDEAKREARRARPGRRRPEGAATAEEGDGEGVAVAPELPPMPVRPILPRTVIDDFTGESLGPLLMENPRGLLVAKDELTGLMGSLNQYRSGKGSDREGLLQIWSGTPIVVDRKGAGGVPIRVPHPFLGILGGIQPDMLGELADAQGRDDGFLDRLLFCYPDPAPRAGWTDEGIPPETAATWAGIVRTLRAVPMDLKEGGGDHPQVVRLTPGGRDAWKAWFDSHQREQEAVDFPDWLHGPWAKIAQYAGRIALTLRLLAWAADPHRTDAVLPDVEAEDIERAATLVGYLKSHTHRVRSMMGSRARGSDGNEAARAILRWVRRHQPGEFSERDLTRNLPRLAERPEELRRALAWLEGRGCLRRRPGPDRAEGKRGRRPSPLYDVNPRLASLLEGRSLAVADPDADDAGDSVNSVNSAETFPDDIDWEDADDRASS